MPGEFEKYAVYWVPKRTDALARFGASWSGWCADQGEHRSRRALGDLAIDTLAITKHASRHGFHAVVKPSFRLGTGRSFFGLEHFLGLLAEECVSFQLPRLRLTVVDGSVALVPSRNSPALSDLVTRIDNALAPFDEIAPANGFAKSIAPAAQPDQVTETDQVVMFPTSVTQRFRIPLTDRIGLELATEVMEKLQPVLDPILREPRQLHDLALMGDPGDNRPLRVLQRYELRDWPRRNESSAMPCHGPHVLVASLNDPLVKAEIAI